MIVFFEEKYHLSEKTANLLHIITYSQKTVLSSRFITRKKTLRRFNQNDEEFKVKRRRVFITVPERKHPDLFLTLFRVT